MASNYVDTTGEEGRFHGPHHHSTSTTPTGAAASSPRTMRRSFSSASSAGGHSHGGGAKCVCAPPTHAGSFKCRLHRTNSQGHGHQHASPPTSPAGGAAPAQGIASSASSRTVEAQ
ncbi:hypothetical protein HU200_043524 [Digitaria exilis]|uniref:Uncharacterized protein n=1 Tax=Digitaria exilis TaxID=1010633 RepID=A0A835B5X1_9POAL|nr:hypothetical protein HU200_043524 [Digitaria exilis]